MEMEMETIFWDGGSSIQFYTKATLESPLQARHLLASRMQFEFMYYSIVPPFLFNLHTSFLVRFFLIRSLLLFLFLITYHIYFLPFFHPYHSLFNILTHSFVLLFHSSVSLSYFCDSSLIFPQNEMSKLKRNGGTEGVVLIHLKL